MRLRWFGQSAFLLTGPAVEVVHGEPAVGPTIGPDQAAAVAAELGARWIVPMHYRTPAIGFLDPVDPFLEAFDDVRRLDGPEAEIDPAARPERPLVLVPSPPGAR